VSLSEAAFELPVMQISPCITPVAQLQLLPSAAAAGGVSSPVSSPSRGLGTPATPGAAAAAAAMVALGPPLLQPKQCVDLHTYIACMVPAAAAAGVVQQLQPQQHDQQQLLLVRLPADSSTGSTALEALLLLLPQGMAAEAWAFYKEQQLALLLHDPTECRSPSVISPTRFGSSNPSSSGGSSSLHLLELSEAPWTQVVAVQQQQQGRCGSVLQQCAAAGAVVSTQDLPGRSRVLQQGHAGQLAVSRTRGLGSLVTDMQHLLLLDLEEDEEEDEEADGDDGMEDADGVDDMQQ